MICPDCGEPQSGCLHTAVDCREVLKRRCARLEAEVEELDSLGSRYDQLAAAITGEESNGAYCFDNTDRLESLAKRHRTRLLGAGELLFRALVQGLTPEMRAEVKAFVTSIYAGDTDVRTCEFCGCQTNAKLRRCCSHGAHRDGGSWYCKACKHVHAEKQLGYGCPHCKCPEKSP